MVLQGVDTHHTMFEFGKARTNVYKGYIPFVLPVPDTLVSLVRLSCPYLTLW